MTSRLLAVVLLCAACASDKSHSGVTQSTPSGSGSAPTAGAAAGDDRSGSMTASPPATVAFRKYAATKLGIPESRVEGGPTTEEEATWFKERVGSLWAMTMFPHDKQQDAVRGWATKDGTVVTVDQNLGLLLAEAGVWGGGATPALTPVEIAERIAWSLGMNHTLFMNAAAGAPPPEIKLTDGAGTMTFVIDVRTPGPGGAGGGPRQLTRFEIALTKDHHATATRTPTPAR